MKLAHLQKKPYQVTEYIEAKCIYYEFKGRWRLVDTDEWKTFTKTYNRKFNLKLGEILKPYVGENYIVCPDCTTSSLMDVDLRGHTFTYLIEVTIKIASSELWKEIGDKLIQGIADTFSELNCETV